VSESRPGANFGAKPITREYADELRAQGVQIVSNFQFGKPGGSAPSDFTRGFDGGVQDARTALGLHEAAGGSDSAPILFSVDDDIDLGTWNRAGVEWFRGINSVLGGPMDELSQNQHRNTPYSSTLPTLSAVGPSRVRPAYQQRAADDNHRAQHTT